MRMTYLLLAVLTLTVFTPDVVLAAETDEKVRIQDLDRVSPFAKPIKMCAR